MTRRAPHITAHDELPAARVDELTAMIITDAIDSLAALRTPYWLGNPAAHLHALTSLIAQAQQMLPDAVHQARDQELTWTQIGQLLNTSAATAARHYRTRP